MKIRRQKAWLIFLRSIYDLRNRYSALFRLSHFNYLIGLRGEIQRLQYFDTRLCKILCAVICIVRFILLRRTEPYSE
jgi:hypothetical protein